MIVGEISDRSGNRHSGGRRSDREQVGPLDVSARTSKGRPRHLKPTDDAPPHGIPRPFAALPDAIRVCGKVDRIGRRLCVDVVHGGVTLRFMWHGFTGYWTRQTIAPLADNRRPEPDRAVIEALLDRTAGTRP